MISIEPPSSRDRNASASALSKAGLVRFLNRARALVGVPGQVDVLLAGDGTLRRLNRQFRGKNKATDVLSFPALAVADGGDARLAGDIAISVETAERQAEAFGHTLRDEVRVLLVHGLLHLQGMDHETDEGEMAAREQELRRALRLPGGLIERAALGGGQAVARRVRRRMALRRTPGELTLVGL